MPTPPRSPISTWLRPPRFRDAATEASPHRQATWLELFIDLVFVFAVASQIEVLREGAAWGDLGLFALAFALTWWLWMDLSYYGDQFDSGGVGYRVALLALAFVVLEVSQLGPGGLAQPGNSGAAFALAGTYLVLAGLYAWAHARNAQMRPLTRQYVGALLLGAAGFLAAGFAPVPLRFGLLVGTLALLMLNSVTVYYRHADLPSQLSHMPERFGLFGIILLGEGVTSVGAATAHAEDTPAFLAMAAVAFATAAGLWWVFFNRANMGEISGALEGGRAALLRSHAYGYSHLLVYLGLAVVSVGIEESLLGFAALDHGGAAPPHPAQAHAMLAGGAGLTLAGCAVVARASSVGLPSGALAIRLLVAAGLGLWAWRGSTGHPGADLLLTCAAVFVVVVAELFLVPHPREVGSDADGG